MILDADVTARIIRHTIAILKNRNADYEIDPTRSVLIALDELANSFEQLTGREQEKKREPT